MVIKNIAIKGWTVDVVKKNEVKADIIIAQKIRRLVLVVRRSVGNIRSAPNPTTDWKLIIIPIQTELFKEDWIWFGAQKEITASANLRRKSVKEKRITLDQTLSPKKANDLLKGVSMIHDEAFAGFLQNRHNFAIIVACLRNEINLFKGGSNNGNHLPLL